MKGLPEALYALYCDSQGYPPVSAVPLTPGGGGRQYWRLSGGENSETVVGCYSPDEAENRTFAALSDALRAGGAEVPEVFALSEDGHAMLQQDLGDVSIFSQFGVADSDMLSSMVTDTMRSLAELQTVNPAIWEGKVAHSPLSKRQIMWDLNYFKYEYLKPSGIPFDEDKLEDDFERLAGEIMRIPQTVWGFMYRDCQSRNVMWYEDHPAWIDFQGGRRGPCLYDAVSFLYQARAPFSKDFRQRMLRVYANVFARIRGVEAEDILLSLGKIRLLRLLQVMGAYGLRGLVEKRAHFIRSIPGALRQLRELLGDNEVDAYPELRRVAQRLVDDARFEHPSVEGLTVTVQSFSYMRGYPEDMSGNGGGFMFDCRAMHNPGRYDEYKCLTGRDIPVIEFLEARGEVGPFLEKVYGLVEPAVSRYSARGFNSLQIGFGCTGGQHRSVYCAEHTARHLKEHFPEAHIRLIHREQGVDVWL